LEMTEGIAAGNSQRTIDLLNQLHALGVALSIDDFGTGYSSLSYLKRFNIDRLKIDQSFVRDLGHDAEDTAIVTAIIGMAIPRPATYGAGPQALIGLPQCLRLDVAQAERFVFSNANDFSIVRKMTQTDERV
jgi:hypothetical protein